MVKGSKIKGALLLVLALALPVVVIAASMPNILSVTVSTGETPPIPGGGPGGGGGSGPETSVTFEGRAYPMRRVTILKDGQKAATTIAGPDAKFQVQLTGLSAGNYLFSVYAEDSRGARSSLFSFPVTLTYGANTLISGIFIAPTIDTDKLQVRQGDDVAIFGQTSPASVVTVAIHSAELVFATTTSDKNGAYLVNYDTVSLDYGQHYTQSKTRLASEVSPYGQAVGFLVGDSNIPITTPRSMLGDLNRDGRVNLVDFSIAAYWYRRVLTPEFAVREKEALNGDGKVDLVDFSIMAYYWTG